MKKLTTIVLGAALVFGLAGQASAAALETTGEYRGRFWYLDNYKSDEGTDFFDQRLRLNGSWKVSETVKVGFRADVLENVWDTTAQEATYKQEIDFDQAFAAIGAGTGTLTVGKQDVTWGPGVYAKSDNRYRVKYGMKFDQIGVTAAIDELSEKGKWSDDDIGYTVGVTFPAAGFNFGVLGIYRDNNPIDASFTAVDVIGSGAAGPVKLSFEAAYGMGEIGSVDSEALLAYIGAFMPLGPVNMGFEFAYSQGDDPDTSDREGAVGHDYNGPFNSFILFNQFDLDGYVSNFGTDAGVTNAMAGKVSATFAASKELSFMGAVVYAVADQENRAGDDEMGWEIDALAKYAMTENVTLQAGVGYLAAGDYFGTKADDPLVVTAHAIVTF